MIIFTKTCHRDLPLLRYMVRSVARHCMEYSAHIVVIERAHRAAAVEACTYAGKKLARVLAAEDILPRFNDIQQVSPYLAQQYVKMMCDRFVTDAFAMMHLDSDMIVEAPWSLADENWKWRWKRVHRDIMPSGIRDQWDARWWMVDELVTGHRSCVAYMYAGCGWHTHSGVWADVRARLQDLQGAWLPDILIGLGQRGIEDFSEYHQYGKYVDQIGRGYIWSTDLDPLYPQVWTYSGRAFEQSTALDRARLARAVGDAV